MASGSEKNWKIAIKYLKQPLRNGNIYVRMIMVLDIA
jgi:hypothetical protein